MAEKQETKNLTLRLDGDVYLMLESAASLWDTTISDLVRQAVGHEITRMADDPEFQTRLSQRADRVIELWEQKANLKS